MSFLRSNIILGILAAALVLSGCTLPGTNQEVSPDAIALWQHQGTTWDIHYSLYDHGLKAWGTPAGTLSAPIAVDEGDDHDPDLSSLESSAIAVWSKSTGGDSIYYSRWTDLAWSKPEKLGRGDRDTDPTVAMGSSSDALSVWVSEGSFLTYSYHGGSSWSSPQRIDTGGLSKVSLPELAAGEGRGVYHLVFTAYDGEGVNAYYAAYAAGSWTVPVKVGAGALLDNGKPTKERTGITASGGQVALVYPGSDGKVHSAKMGSAAKAFGSGAMPDVAYDSLSRAAGAFQSSGDLLYQSDVHSPSGTLTISSLSDADQRPSLTFILDKKVGLALFWNTVSAPGDVYYSYLDSGSWSAPALIDPLLGSGIDRNPAVSPLEARIEPQGPYCGDKVIQAPEQCEAGIACANPNDWCNLGNCQCVPSWYPPENDSVDCSFNTWTSALGITLWAPGMICQDDCKAAFGKDWSCDAACDCVQAPAQPPTNLSCSGNSFVVAFGGANLFGAGVMCLDDCQSLDPDLVCDAKTCLCEEKTDPKEVSCFSNTLSGLLDTASSFQPGMLCKDDCLEQFDGQDVYCDAESCLCKPKETPEVSCYENSWAVGFDGPSLYGAGMLCMDDCVRLGAGLECDAESCVCKERPDPKVYCAAHTESVIESDVNGFDSSGMICEDNCKEVLGDDYECAVSSCTCVHKPKEDLSCAGNSLGTGLELVTGASLEEANMYDPSKMICKDDCQELYGDDYVCEAEACLCQYSPVSGCAQNTLEVDRTDENGFDPSQMRCQDNCVALLGPGYQCNAQSCTCTRPPGQQSCAANTEDHLLSFSVPDAPAGLICKDDCDYFAEYGVDAECDAKTCTCVPKPEKMEVACAAGTYVAYDYGINLFDPSSMICKDNCEELGEGLSCDAQKCVCRKKPGSEIYCAANTADAYVGAAVGDVSSSFDPNTMICKDNCEDFGDDYRCDPQTCYCYPDGSEGPWSCAGNTEFVDMTDVNQFDSKAMQCKDDCAENRGEGYSCNPQSCTCTKGGVEKPDVSCSANSRTTTEHMSDKYPDGFQCVDDCEEMMGSGYECATESCSCIPAAPEICGDGALGAGEACDYGGSATNRCPEGADPNHPLYCTEKCECKQIEHSPRCGDGKITGSEGCDGGNVKTNICPTGYKCYTPECMCIAEEGSGQCGDGTVTAPEECDHGNSFTSKCPSGLSCHSCMCIPPEDVPEEAYCGNDVREGAEECDGNDDSSCSSSEYCSSNCQCVEEDIPTYCGDGQVNGGEQCDPQASPDGCDSPMACGSSCKCVSPPTLDCGQICSATPGASSFGGQYSSSTDCKLAVADYHGQSMCYLTCSYAWYYSVSNVAGTASCCCGMKKEYPCDDCPGTSPTCPGEDTCKSNAPSWVTP